MYLVLILICILLYYFNKNNDSRKTIKSYVIFITLLLVAVSGFRHEAVGNDTYAYMRAFDNFSASWSDIFIDFWDAYLNPGVNGNGKDPGEQVIIKTLTYVIPNSRCFLFVVSVMILIPLGVFVYRNSETLETPCFFYVFYITMFYPYLPNSAIRQSFALTLLLIGFLLLQKGKWKSFLALLFIATFIHKSIFIAILILPFYYLKQTRVYYRLSLLLFVMMLFTYQYVGILLSAQSEIYEMYGTGAFYAYNQSVPYMVILMMFGLYLVGWLGIKNDDEAVDMRLMYGGAAMSLVWVVMVRLDPSLIRMTAYFGPWMGLMVPHALRKWKPNSFETIFTLILIIFTIRAFITPDNYHFMWQEMKLHDRY